ncbi:MAG: M1 family peptidase, partial [Bacteroidetes bacterium]
MATAGWLLATSPATAQTKSWQQRVDFKMDVTLIDSLQQIQGASTVTYTNNSPDTLQFIWFHIWGNAYANDSTAFSQQLLEEGNTSFYFSKKEERGFVNPLQFTQGTNPLFIEWHPKFNDVVKVILPQPLLPKTTTQLQVNFVTKLPYNISRGGYTGQTFQACQWYPKPAVYDADGWHPMPYLSSGEFYSNFGTYDVTLHLPENYLVTATGVLTSADKVALLKDIAKRAPAEQANNLAYQTRWKKVAKEKNISKWQAMPPSAKVYTSWQFKADFIHDFAWFASKLFVVQQDTLRVSNQDVLVQAFYHPWEIPVWKNATKFAKRGAAFYSQALGKYPYQWLNIIAGNEVLGSGGMEYAGATLITSSSNVVELDNVIAHEVGHNWLQGALANNERQYPWLDEGINTFYEKKYLKAFYPPKKPSKKWPFGFNEMALLFTERLRQSQPIASTSEEFTSLNYGSVAYEKAGIWMRELETLVGQPTLQNAMQQYYQQYAFAHPTPANFKAVISAVADSTLVNQHWKKLYSSASIIQSGKQQQRLTFFANGKNFYSTQYHNIIPVIGSNTYDGFGLGLGIHNYQFNLPKVQYFVLPYFSFRSKQWNGATRVSYNIYQPKYRFHVRASLTTFTADNFLTDKGNTLQQRVIRFVPSAQYVGYFSPLKTYHKWWVQARLFQIQEQQLNFTATDVSTVPNNYHVAQLQAGISNQRTLYPYSIEWQLEQGKGFIRTSITAKQFFHYGNGNGGIQARFFAGKFIYTVPNTFLNQATTARFHLQMTGPRGNEDYTYSGYYRGRNDFEGWNSQQLMERDGFFKVGTDLLATKVGRSDDWLLATNLVADIPERL